MAGEDAVSVTTNAPPATEHWNLSLAGPGATSFGAGATDDGAASVTMNWTLTSDQWATAGVPIKPAASCAPAVTSAVAEISPNRC